ncbi:thymidine kinase [Asticcacaulis sp. BYS171W]|uniref:Thymidine kinase n=1 Tax=Asticcacaulis aquaticus TaxID=2984212 RepID=A0ABT5HQE0_9CAUL|nr:thymidine kinase [Asticcacaulis aquaticus]MDC7682290.1 thymidine kinase [Asticcacaulis aquaticus]
MYGKLTVICGPMFAGKTTELLKRILWARNGENKNVLVLKTAFDNRYADTRVVSHNGLSADAKAIRRFADIADLSREAELVCLDEVQFFTGMDMDVVEFVSDLLHGGRDIVVAGLDTNWKGEPFPATALLMAMADEVIKLKAHCSVCGQPAYKSFKKLQDGREIVLGNSDIYEARCNQHWIAERIDRPQEIAAAHA